MMAKRASGGGKPPEKLKLKSETVGSRIAKQRDKIGMTQEELGKRVGRGRSAIAQWERDDSEPNTQKFALIAEALETTPQYLAFGITQEPKVVMPSSDEMGFAIVEEVTYGNRPADTVAASKWALPVEWLRADIQAARTDGLTMYKVDAAHGAFEYGDRVVVDKNVTRISPPGNFLIWDGVGPMVAHVAVAPGGAGRKTMARVSGPTGDYEIDADKLQVIGKVKGVFKKA